MYSRLSFVGVTVAAICLCSCQGIRDMHLIDDYGGYCIPSDYGGPEVGFMPDRRQITDADLAVLSAAVRRQDPGELNLEDTDIGDAALVDISRLQSLVSLRLNGTHVTPAGVGTRLRGMQNLRELYVNAETFGPDQIDTLQHQLPNVRINRMTLDQGRWRFAK